MSNERYLGDGVYAEIERGMVKLTTRVSVSPPVVTNTIWLEPEIARSLMNYLLRTVPLFHESVQTETVFTRLMTEEEMEVLFNEGKELGFIDDENPFKKEEK